MLKVALVAEASPGLDAINVNPVPGCDMERLEKTAAVAPVFAVKLPPRAPPPGLLLSVKVTGTEEVVVGFPDVSSAITMIEGAIEKPTVVSEGCVTKARWGEVCVGVTTETGAEAVAYPVAEAVRVEDPAAMPV
jgi:hypothetical protein